MLDEIVLKGAQRKGNPENHLPSTCTGHVAEDVLHQHARQKVEGVSLFFLLASCSPKRTPANQMDALVDSTHLKFAPDHTMGSASEGKRSKKTYERRYNIAYSIAAALLMQLHTMRSRNPERKNIFFLRVKPPCLRIDALALLKALALNTSVGAFTISHASLT